MTFVIYRDIACEWRWHLLSDSNKTLAKSAEGYETKPACIAAIIQVKGAYAAQLVDESEALQEA